MGIFRSGECVYKTSFRYSSIAGTIPVQVCTIGIIHERNKMNNYSMEQSTLLCNASIDTSPEKFWSAIKIWMTNPHVINRRLVGHADTSSYKLESNENYLYVYEKLFADKKSHVEPTFVNNLRDLLEQNVGSAIKQVNLEDIWEDIQDIHCDLGRNKNEQNVVYVSERKLLPRNPAVFQSCSEFVILDKSCNVVLFCGNNWGNEGPLLIPHFPYRVQLNKNELNIYIYYPGTLDNPVSKWLSTKLFPKLCTWAQSEIQYSGFKSSSLSLLNVEEYSHLYQKLKVKYGAEMVKIWPERTDPAKFVYEDISIATYLLLLWREERRNICSHRMQSFVDLGCGNGLLVYILSSEGHPGFGIDLRKRGIWDLYPETTILKISAITPSDSFLYPETDWLIGNHSDELTPWIPVMAARSSPTCRFFLLPCCAYQFNGSKYQRQNSSKSIYNEYLEYVEQVSNICGFNTVIDKMRIPSTKRICLIGINRSCKTDFIEKCTAIQQFLDDECKTKKSTDIVVKTDEQSGNWSKDFKPRESIEKVQNCTQINKNVIQDIVGLVSKHLLSEVRYISCGSGKNWNAGGIVTIESLASSIIPQETLSRLKKECGGLQTLLKNNHNIFEVFKGNVQLRMPRNISQINEILSQKKFKGKDGNSRIILKKKLCWFHSSHPDGCPLAEDECSFVH